MTLRIWSSPWGRLACGVVVLIGCCAAAARAGFPHPEPPFSPPRDVSPEPPIFIPPPVDPDPLPPIDPPPVQTAPEPGTLVLGLIGAGVAGIAARRRRKMADSPGE
jgi:hypothetical protein